MITDNNNNTSSAEGKNSSTKSKYLNSQIMNKDTKITQASAAATAVSQTQSYFNSNFHY